ncbi:MAG: ribosomal L7Ae/L30e/S12e/Gadd45 family protein [Clostridia bacterium]|nr:ribosomal L7Ae/L30e/S12e/Gadd45 family protein [Clostridia bacterium]
MDNGEKKSLLFRIGLGRRAGKLIIGTEMVCDGVRDGKVLLILLSSRASDNSKKRILGCADYYNAEVETIDVTTEELGAAIGKSAVACVGITDENIVRLINSRQKNK